MNRELVVPWSTAPTKSGMCSSSNTGSRRGQAGLDGGFGLGGHEAAEGVVVQRGPITPPMTGPAIGTQKYRWLY